MTTVQLAILVPLVAVLLWVGLGGLVAWLADGPDRSGHGRPGRASGETEPADAEPGPAALAPEPSRIPRLLWPVLGFAASIVLTNSISRLGIVLPFNAIIVVALAIAGLWLQRRRLVPTPAQALLALLAAGPAVAAFSGALLLAGPTITGYLLDTNTGVHSLGADFLLHHGGDFASIPRDSTDRSMVTQFFVDSSYPSGAHAIYGLLGALTASSLTFVSTPMMGICLAVAALATAAAARRLDIAPIPAAVAGFLVTCGALVFAFALSSELKEVVTLPLLAGMTAFALDPRGLRSIRSLVIVGAVLATALYSVLGIASAAWAAPFVIFTIGRTFLASSEGRSPIAAAKALGLTAVLSVVLVGPLMPGLADQLSLANNLSQTNANLAADPGNLLGPIGKVQALGTWIGPDHRVWPTEVTTTYALIGISWLLVAIGAIALLRERRWSAAIWLAGLTVLWFLLTERGTLWLDSKLVMLSGLVLMLLVVKGATWLAADRGRRWLTTGLTLVLLTPVIAGVLLSDLRLYQSTTTASNARYEELEAIDRELAGKGPVYFTEFDEYAMYTLRATQFIGSGYGDTMRDKPAVGEPGFGYGQSADLDRVPFDYLQEFPYLITLRSPGRSLPGTDWTRVREGRFFDVWRRDPAASDKILEHLPVGGAVDRPKCRLVQGAARRAEAEGAKLVARVAKVPTTIVGAKAEWMTPNWAASFSAAASVAGDGRLVMTVPRAVRGADRDLWILGVVGRPLRVTTGDGRELGTFDRLAAGDGNAIGPVRIPAGTTTLLVSSTKRQLRPSDKSPTVLRAFAYADPEPSTLRTVEPRNAASLCDQPVDWIEVVRP